MVTYLTVILVLLFTANRCNLLSVRSSIVDAITNNDYFGEIANMGDSVKVIKEPEITVKAYERGTTITPQDLDDEEFSLNIDKANYFAFKVDDIEEAHSHVNFQAVSIR
jgi:hypothetical protein